MNTLHAPMICALALALGGCLSPTEATRAPVAVPVAAAPAADVPPVTEPGQPLRSVHRRGGVDPFAELQASEQARVAWTPLHPGELTRPAAMAARNANMAASGQLDPSGTASLSPAAKGDAKADATRDGLSQGYDGEAKLDRLESDARKISKPICSGC